MCCCRLSFKTPWKNPPKIVLKKINPSWRILIQTALIEQFDNRTNRTLSNYKSSNKLICRTIWRSLKIVRIRSVRLIVSSSTKFDNRIRSTSSTNILVRQSSIIRFVRQVQKISLTNVSSSIGIFVEFNRIISLPEKFDQVRLKLIELNRTISLSEKFD